MRTIEDLKQELAAADAKVKRIAEDKATCGKRLTDAKDKVGTLKATFEGTRKNRQIALYSGCQSGGRQRHC